MVGLLLDVPVLQEGETVYDPACGAGGMLIEVIEHVKANGGRPQTLWGTLYGQEKVLAPSGIARVSLFLHGIGDFEIACEDTLRAPVFFDVSRPVSEATENSVQPTACGICRSRSSGRHVDHLAVSRVSRGTGRTEVRFTVGRIELRLASGLANGPWPRHRWRWRCAECTLRGGVTSSSPIDDVRTCV